ncbi:hypothetical protein JN11_00743 [Mucilaginibacter frigoritolerans]|uniref:Uncharacterized protein n=1 Tax=Mucilaginibacter frigoritolerans TaxID=652788 RepID=A0A562UBQ9_9SPHI|nr:hypothetical protein [Mucilaginibacter frigoritolerans]TWJ03206.1 hypothetical protein JN11_00743 [Mucilaginibacter frigoritolerans]
MKRILGNSLAPEIGSVDALTLAQLSGRGLAGRIIDYPHLIKTAIADGMKYFFVEQSRYFNETQLQSPGVNTHYMKNLVL